MYGEDDYPSGDDELEIIQEPVDIAEPQLNENVEENQADQGAAPDDPNKKEPKIRVVRNPQPKLNAERLRGPRGVVVLEDIFKQVKFKGSKHEEEDLTLLMKTYEYWCHRMFPKFPFDNCLERLETLGHNKTVQSYLKSIRMNLVLDDAPIVDDDDDDDDAVVQAVPADSNTPIIDLFDNLLARPLTQPSQSGLRDSGELSEEQLERIRLNRERAQQRRKEIIQNPQVTRGTDTLSNYVTEAHCSKTIISSDLHYADESYSQTSQASSEDSFTFDTTDIQSDTEFTTLQSSVHNIPSISQVSEIVSDCMPVSNAQQDGTSVTNVYNTNGYSTLQTTSDKTTDSTNNETVDQIDAERMSVVCGAVSQESVNATHMSIYSQEESDGRSQIMSPDLNEGIHSQSSDMVMDKTPTDGICNTMARQKSSSCLTQMSIDSEKNIEVASAEEMITSEIDSPMDYDTT